MANNELNGKLLCVSNENKLIKQQLEYLRNFIAQSLSFPEEMMPSCSYLFQQSQIVQAGI